MIENDSIFECPEVGTKETNGKENGVVKCEICGKELRSRYYLKIHVRVHTREKNFICGICNKGYQQKWNLITHVARIHSKEKPFKCSDCGKAFGYSSHFKRHVKEHFLEKIEAPPAVKGKILNPHDCKNCEKRFQTKYRLNLHMKIHMRIHRFPCIECGKSFTSQKVCERHYVRMHLEKLKFCCRYCQLYFSTSSNYSHHMKTAHETKEMPSNEATNREIPKVKDFESSSCRVCGKKVGKRSLRKHLNIHFRNRVYRCRYCDKDFPESGQRTIHERRHTGEKPYECDICDRKFSQYSNLLTHRKRLHHVTTRTSELWKRKRKESCRVGPTSNGVQKEINSLKGQPEFD